MNTLFKTTIIAALITMSAGCATSNVSAEKRAKCEAYAYDNYVVGPSGRVYDLNESPYSVPARRFACLITAKE